MKLSRAQALRIGLFGIALIAMLLLAAGLSNVDLEPGLPFERIWAFLMEQLGRGGLAGPTYGTIPGGETLIAVVRAIFFMALVFFPFAVILIVIDPELRKRVLRTTMWILLLFIAVGAFLRNQTRDLEMELETNGMPQGRGDELYAEPIPSDQFEPGEVPSWLIWGASLTTGLLIAGVAVIIVNQIRRGRDMEKAPLKELGQHAQSAIDEIEQGGDLRNTIVRCYAEMNRVVRDQRGVRRDRYITAREFTNYLARAHLPPEPVYALTRLFEKARYGSGPTSAEDETTAITSLRAIVQACESEP